MIGTIAGAMLFVMVRAPLITSTKVAIVDGATIVNIMNCIAAQLPLTLI